MEIDVARWLVSPEAEAWLAWADEQPDPASLATATALRRTLAVDRAAAVIDQAVLRRRAAAKTDGRLRFLTASGLEQATRADVAQWRAARLASCGVRTVVDLGCGLGVDALAMRHAGMDVVAVERDPVVAVLAGANLGIEVLVGDATEVAPSLLRDPATAVFCDPARRTARGRTWDVADLSPSWDLVLGLLDGSRTACVKLGPGVPHRLLPADAEVTWVAHDGDGVEATVWAGPGATPGRRAAVLLPAGAELEARSAPIPVGQVGRWLVEPDPAVIRSGAASTLALVHGLHSLADGVAYLSSDHRPDVSPYGTVFEVLDTLPYDLRALRAWVRENRIGSLEIKKRGVDLDPAALRRQLKPKGPAAATLVVTPTTDGVRVLVARRG